MAKSLIELRDRERVAPDWIIPGLIKRGNTAFMLGVPKRAVKSWLVLAMAWDLAEGLPVWGIKDRRGEPLFVPPRPMRTVYFTQEDEEDDAQDRVLAHINGGHRPVNDRVWVVPKNLQAVLDTFDGKRLIQEQLDEVKQKAGDIDLVVFDPMRRMHHGDENDSSTIAAIWAVIDKIHKRYRCSTMFVHHTIKPPTDKNAKFDPSNPFTARGSGDIYGGGDAFIVSLPGAGDEAGRKVALHFESKRGKPLPPALVKVAFETGAVNFLGLAESQGGEEEAKGMGIRL